MAEVERQWFTMVLGGEQIPFHYITGDNPDGEFDDVDGADVAEAFATWRSECADALRSRTARRPSAIATSSERRSPIQRHKGKTQPRDRGAVRRRTAPRSRATNPCPCLLQP
jgi:hypothetical protein